MKRPITWMAYACNFSSADVLLGLAPGLDDAALRATLSPTVLARYPSRRIPVTDRGGVSASVELRLYALRDASICKIEHQSANTDVQGFHRVKICFVEASAPHSSNDAIRRAWDGAEVSAIVDAAGDDAAAAPPVIGFLLTVGLTIEQEESFFKTLLDDFLSKSWSSLPKLLREVGCTEPSHDAA